ncbi:MAG TPA: M3 family oligoendopeptidase [Deinococcales bacterium]|nr:M3 family oligoendopeptidase [Deinococcales bacterium]
MTASNLDPRSWESIEPHFRSLEQEDLTAEGVPQWLARWSELEKAIGEAGVAAYRARTEDTTDEAAERAYLHLVENVQPRVRVASNALKAKLLAVPGLSPTPDTEVLLTRFRAEAAAFREENAPVYAELAVMGSEYDRIAGAMTVTLDGEELTVQQASVRLEDPDRTVREEAWRLVHDRWLRDRKALNDLYLRMLRLRRQLARNADLPDYRALAWVEMNRFDYGPEDALRFNEAIEGEVVPLVSRLMWERKERMGLPRLRPWDLDADPEARPGLKPFTSEDDLESGVARMLEAVDPELGRDFALLRDGYLDLGSRRGKAPGGYCDFYPQRQRPYIFMNAAGTHDDVMTLLHEAGHAFHALAGSRANTLYFNQGSPMEFAEVASMSMELLASPFLERERGGFYSPEDASRARAGHLESTVRFLPYMAVVDAFQHWVYAEAPEDVAADDLDAKWGELWSRFMPDADWTGLEDSRVTGWQRKLHIFQIPFYYIEYGLAQTGAWQVWRNALADGPRALSAYRDALALGYTRPITALYEAAGARLAFDREHVGSLARFINSQLAGSPTAR